MKQYVLYCPHCGFVIHFFDKEGCAAYGLDRLCPKCWYVKLKRRAVFGDPDAHSGWIPFHVTHDV